MSSVSSDGSIGFIICSGLRTAMDRWHLLCLIRKSLRSYVGPTAFHSELPDPADRMQEQFAGNRL